MRLSLLWSMPALLLAVPAGAQELWVENDNGFGGDSYFHESEDKALTLRGSIGAIGIEAKEYVFEMAGSPNMVSYLVWQSVAPMASADVTVHLPDQWTVKAEVKAAISGESNMEDYDWFGPDFAGYNFDNWTHRSVSPNTNLDWYLDGALSVGKDLVDDGAMRINLNGGVKYTDVRWTSYGGTYTYSSFPGGPAVGFRGTSGTLPDGPGITYRQQLPTLFAGLDIEARENGWTYAANARGGMALFGYATDDHWLRSLHFVDVLNPAPMLSASASATYDFSDNFGAFVEGGIEKVFRMRGDAEITNTSTGTYLGKTIDAAGAELGTINVSAGLKGSF
jgi:outer membrane protease